MENLNFDIENFFNLLRHKNLITRYDFSSCYVKDNIDLTFNNIINMKK